MNVDTPSNDDFDPIAAAWADQAEAAEAPDSAPDPATLADSVAKAHRKDQLHLLWLNIREIVPSLLLAGVCAALAPDSTRPVAMVAAALMALAIGGFLAGSSIRHHRADGRWGSSVRDQMARRLAQLEHRAWMYRHLAWWYFLPLTLSVTLLWYGLDGGIGVELAVFGPLYAVYVVVAYRTARQNGRNRYESEAERLQLLLAEFDRPI